MYFSKFLKPALVVGFLALAAIPAVAQQTYIKAGAMHNFGLGSTISAYTTTGTVNRDNTIDLTIEQEKINFGQGWLFNVAVGHFFNQNVGAELGLGYLPGKAHKTESRVYHANYGVTEGFNQTYSSRMFLIQPSVVVRTNPKTITPYGRFGFTVSKGSIKETSKHTLWTDSEEQESEYTGGLGFGFQGALGVDFVANEQVTFYTEATFSSLAWSPEKWELTAYRENNTTALDNLSPGAKETIYSDKFSVKYDKNGNLVTSNGPKNELKDYLPMNTIGLALGIKITF